MRNRYLDLLRAAAIVRVIVYHLFGWPWLSVVLPAMGVMFALAGSLTAASLSKRDAGQVVVSRLRRLLPPLWLLGVIAVPVMLVAGWATENDGEHPFNPATLAFWILPIGDPPGSDQAIDVWEPLWYLRAYLWFVLLSPVLFALWRRIGWATVALPLVLMAVLDVTGFELPDTADSALWDFVTYGACWIAGFAHHDGRLARLRPWVAFPVALALGAGAAYFAHDYGSFDLNEVAESQALWSLAFVLVVLRWQPPMGWLARIKPLDHAVSVINARAVTIYLWHNTAIAAVWPVLTVLALGDLGDRLSPVSDLAVALALTLGAMVAFGWAEDVAARRRPRLWPSTGRAATPPPENAPREAIAPDRPAAMARSSAAAAMARTPANWPPIPRGTGGDAAAGGNAATAVDDPAERRGGTADLSGHAVGEGGAEPDGRHQSPGGAGQLDPGLLRRDPGPLRRDPGLPVAGRRVDPLDSGTPARDPFPPGGPAGGSFAPGGPTGDSFSADGSAEDPFSAGGPAGDPFIGEMPARDPLDAGGPVRGKPDWFGGGRRPDHDPEREEP
ncbi:acyltransferase [Actinoplanes sp. M2I2]|uniref:acyltransferase family protein n=1 Tax=Actinoplanes sp. M2I2 TaxID=1734444 RepID=UPI002021317B|nr:acyltransferase [Actinoplanes sp. M2I2]